MRRMHGDAHGEEPSTGYSDSSIRIGGRATDLPKECQKTR